jgi:transcriptional regulator GlxA family with amidase domain
MDVIFDLSPRSVAGGPLETSFAVGTMTRPLPVLSSGSVHLIGVRFRPAGALPFLDLAAHELVDERAALDALWGSEAPEALERVHEGGMNGLDALLVRRLPKARRDDRTVRRAAGLLAESSTPGRVDEVASALSLGRRQLERRFRDAVGVPPSTLVRILRFRRAVALLGAPARHPLSRVAVEAGYHDQPHMNRDFRELAGMTPGAYRATLPAT